MEIIQKEDHVQFYVNKRYFILPNDIRILRFVTPNLMEMVYPKLMAGEYKYELYNVSLDITMSLTNAKKSINHTFECEEIYPYLDLNIVDETSRENLLKCIQCLKNKLKHEQCIMKSLEEDLDNAKRELKCIEDEIYSDQISGSCSRCGNSL